MRFLRLLVVPALLAVGCSAVVPGEDIAGDSLELSKGKSEGSVAWGPCVYSRDVILRSVSRQRADVISRGFTWLDANVPFDMGAYRQGYRTDCSGFVSMSWGLPTPGITTRDFSGRKSTILRLDSFDNLVPADALVRSGSHSFIFLGWNDKDRKGMCVLEQSSTKNDMQFRVRMTDTLRNEGFVPYRHRDFENDTEVSYDDGGDGLGGGTLTPTPIPTEDGGTTNPTPTPPDDDNENEGEAESPPPVIFPPFFPPICYSEPRTTTCERAMAEGYQCGLAQDNCGRPVDCSDFPGYGCQQGATCGDDYKCTTSCTVKYPQDKCYAAKTKQGVQCGKIPDGCGGEIDCDQYTYFGCRDGAQCESNKCPASGDPKVAGEDDPFAPSNDLGDVSDSPSSVRTQANEETLTTPPSARRPSAASESAGCSAAPGADLSSGFGMSGLALGIFAMLGRRRRTRR